MRKIALCMFLLLLLCGKLHAQTGVKATLSASDAGTCATANACLAIPITSASGGATFAITANASANTIQFEASADYGLTWVALNAIPSNSTTAATSTTGTGTWQANVAGYTNARLRCSTFVAGTATTYINLSTASARSGGGVGAGGTSAFGPNFSVGGGVAQFQTVSPTTPITNATLVAGYELCWLPVASNTGAIPTLAGAGTSTFSATFIVKNGVPTNLIANDITLGTVACVKYDGMYFQLQNPQAGLVASASLTLGGGAAAAGATATGGFAAGEATNTGWTPTAGQDYMRADSTLHTFLCSLNGAAEAACASSSISGLTAATGPNTTANGNNPQTWNWAQTTDSQAGFTPCGETSAATGGTLTNGLANQSACNITTATNSTAVPLNITQGSITNTVATPAAQWQTTWNNAGLAGRGLVFNVTNTTSAANSLLASLNVGGVTAFNVDKTGLTNFEGSAAQTSAPPASGGTGNIAGWKYCFGFHSNPACVAFGGQQEYHYISGNSWFGVSSVIPLGNSGGTNPDTASGTALSNGGVAGALYGKEGACSSFTGVANGDYLCSDSTAHEWLGTTAGSSTFGMMVRRQPTPIDSGDLTAAVSTATLCAASAGACNIAGQYEVHFDFIETGTACGTPGTGGVTFLLTWTDANGTAHSAVSLGMDDASAINSVSQTFHFQTSLAAAWASGQFTLSSNGSIIQYATGYTACGVGTGTYRIQASVLRLK